jgi:predicted nucleic acid-binding protein
VRVALDTNVLAYAEGVNVDAGPRQEDVRELIDRLPQEDVILPVQVLGELFNVLTRKAGWPRPAARDGLLGWSDTFEMADTTSEILMEAADLAAAHELRIWDAVILSAASAAGCRLLLSEDFQDGFTWGGVTVTNPFAATRHPLLEGILSGGDTSSF